MSHNLLSFIVYYASQSVAHGEDQEARIATLEKRYVNTQRESAAIYELNEKLQAELVAKENQLHLVQYLFLIFIIALE